MTDPIYNRIEGQPRPSIFAASGLILLAAVGLWASDLLLGLLGADGGAAMALENAVSEAEKNPDRMTKITRTMIMAVLPIKKISTPLYHASSGAVSFAVSSSSCGKSSSENVNWVPAPSSSSSFMWISGKWYFSIMKNSIEMMRR